MTTASAGMSLIWREPGSRTRPRHIFAALGSPSLGSEKLFAVPLIDWRVTTCLNRLTQSESHPAFEHVFLVGQLASQLPTSTTRASEKALQVRLGAHAQRVRQPGDHQAANTEHEHNSSKRVARVHRCRQDGQCDGILGASASTDSALGCTYSSALQWNSYAFRVFNRLDTIRLARPVLRTRALRLSTVGHPRSRQHQQI